MRMLRFDKQLVLQAKKHWIAPKWFRTQHIRPKCNEQSQTLYLKIKNGFF